MQVISYLIVGILIGFLDYFMFKKDKNLGLLLKTLFQGIVMLNVISLGVLKFIFGKVNVIMPSTYTSTFSIKYIIFTLLCGLLYLFVKGVMNSKITFKQVKDERDWKNITIKVLAIIFFTVGVLFVFFSKWFIDFYGQITPEQFLFNLSSPLKGTSTDMVKEIISTPIFSTVILVVLFLIAVSFNYEIFLKIKDSNKKILSRKLIVIVVCIASLGSLFGGIAYGVKKLSLGEVVSAYVSDSSYIEDNYVNPNTVKMSFPKKKRNLIHIYLESMENTYFSKDLGGYMEENLMPELAELSKEGVHFSESDKFGGPYQTYGSSWSVASMINMGMGIPLKIAMDGNSYGKSGSFLPGAVGIGDILDAQGYEQTIMFGADADFGGLTTYFTTHGNFNVFDYKAAKEKKLIPEDYYVWWGYEDDKLFEYAKDEITRLSNTGKPFNFTMETADTHWPDGYLSPNAEKKYDSQYANVIAYSSKQAVEFIRWIQSQPFYEDTTIVVTGDHLSMEKNFFANFDPAYHRTVFNLILNSPITADKTTNRKFSVFDMYPTMLTSMGVEIDGDRLGLGTNLFSDKKTLIEKDGLEAVEKGLGERSNFFNEKFVSEKMNSKFENKLVTEREK